MSFCDDCFKGAYSGTYVQRRNLIVLPAVRHEGTPVGKVEKINGVETYVTLPEGQYKKDTAIRPSDLISGLHSCYMFL
jgi:hypothetical protein